ncbi:MAG: hypothetical protein Q6358_03805 [Candidatus Brocadiales bacterium]|nr:hypothetical protein [Candidatus Brocadiales bacterium]
MNVIGEAKKCNVGLSEVECEFYEERCAILQFDDGKRYLKAPVWIENFKQNIVS